MAMALAFGSAHNAPVLPPAWAASKHSDGWLRAEGEVAPALPQDGARRRLPSCRSDPELKLLPAVGAAVASRVIEPAKQWHGVPRASSEELWLGLFATASLASLLLPPVLAWAFLPAFVASALTTFQCCCLMACILISSPSSRTATLLVFLPLVFLCGILAVVVRQIPPLD